MIIFNFIMAFTITMIIVVMSIVKNSRLKAIVYGLPLPITTALIATRDAVNSSHITGLFLLCLFLWSVFHLYEKRGISILVADLMCAFGYITLGFLFIKLTLPSFWITTSLYLFFWFFYVYKYKPSVETGEKSRIRPLFKGPIVFVLAVTLLFLKSVLGGALVTFPFSGVFAVVEAKKTLYTLAGEFTKNSLAILIFFVAIKAFSYKLSFYYSIGIGWLVYLPSLLILQKIKK